MQVGRSTAHAPTDLQRPFRILSTSNSDGGPLIAPASSALLRDGDLIVINDDANIAAGQKGNLAIEVSPVLSGGFVGVPLQLDSGVASGLFGVVATVDAQGKQIVYFNDDNTNTVVMLAE